ncbi:nucleotide disphospho-sugar-binding domain-containing protein [Micromonospora sp. NPDC047467]|uniref:nucleotide disphospho-sugar-binding domain-containing protein n=1 Tax=Micromonospora sp. NPDC047467 TaxID=3154814 RepID=UPI0033DD2D8E
MRVLITVYPAVAHLYPVVPYAWALQSAGHEVRVASHAGFADTIASTGLVPVALGDAGSPEPRLRDDARQPPTPEDVNAYARALGLSPEEREHWIAFYQWNLNPASDYVRADLPDAPDLVEFARAWRPDLVLWDLVFPAGAVAARAAGAAHGRLLGSNLDYFAFSQERLATHRDAVRRAGLATDPLGDLVRPLAERYGMTVDDELLLGQFTVDPLPKGLSLSTATTKVAVRKVPYTGASVFPRWLYARPQGRPRVALSLGESTRRYVAGDWGRTPKLLAALAELDVEVVATLSPLQLEAVGTLPDNVRAIEWVPLTQLLPTCDVLVHHGGMGTLSSAVAAGIPQLVCDTDDSLLFRPASAAPAEVDSGTYRVGREFGTETGQAAEEAAGWLHPEKNLLATPCASYVTDQGAGVRLDHQKQSVEEIRAEIHRVLSEPAFREAATRLRDTWQAIPSPAEIVPALVALAERRP